MSTCLPSGGKVALLLWFWLSPSILSDIPKYRSYDGSGNNADHPDWGRVMQPYLRYPPYKPRYGTDGNSMLDDLPNPRVISNILGQLGPKRVNERRLNEFHTTWAHLITHDTFQTMGSTHEEVPIRIPQCDVNFDLKCTGDATLPFTRSAYIIDKGVRQQVNEGTSYLDGSAIYGSDPQRAAALRTFVGGKMLLNEDGELPLNIPCLYSINPMQRNLSTFRLVADGRNNVTPQLLSLISVFLRDHNRYCDELHDKHPEWDDETLYQEARRRIVAHIQHITFWEYIPAVLGQPLPLYAGYNSSVDATMDNFCCTCAFRYAHPEITSMVMRLTRSWVATPGGNLLLQDAVFNPELSLSEGIEPVLRGMLYTGQWQVDPVYENDLRNHLFELPGVSQPSDLLALDIQRGRDHGLAGYNAMREAFGLLPKTTFEQITTDRHRVAALKKVYPSVDDIDPIVGALAEDATHGSVGELIAASLRDQFRRMRDGDSFWYENNQFSPEELQQIRDTKLATIINRNTDIRYNYENTFFRHDTQLDGGLFRVDLPTVPELDEEFQQSLNLHSGYRLYWTVDRPNSVIHFAVLARTLGWIGIGFSQYDARQPLHSAMYHADMAIGHMTPEGTAEVRDYFSFEVGIPSLDVALGCDDDLTDGSIETNGTLRIMRFTKPFETLDSKLARGALTEGDDVVKRAERVQCDTGLREGVAYYIIFAFNSVQNEILYHGATRGFDTTMLIPRPSWLPQHTLIAIGSGLGAVAVIILGFTFVFLRHRKGKDNLHAPRVPPFCILFTDIEQSTTLWSLDAPATTLLLEKHNAIIRSLIDKYEAFEVKTIGDSFMMAIKEPLVALRIAVDIQLMLHSEMWPQCVVNLLQQLFPDSGNDCWNGPRVRIGIHYADCQSGVVVELDRVSGSYDYFGNPVNIAARIESLAHGGQILLSSDMIKACPTLESCSGMTICPLGVVRIRGVSQLMEVFQLVPQELAGRHFPSLEPEPINQEEGERMSEDEKDDPGVPGTLSPHVGKDTSRESLFMNISPRHKTCHQP